MTGGRTDSQEISSRTTWHNVVALFAGTGTGQAELTALARRNPRSVERMVNSRQFALRRVILAMDTLSIVLSMGIAAALHSALRNEFDLFKNPPPLEQYMLLAWLTIPMMLGLVSFIGLHRQYERPFRPLPLVWDLIRLHASSLVGITLLVFLTQIPLNRSLVALFLGTAFVLMSSSRVALHLWRRRTHATGENRAHLLLISNDSPLVSLVASAAADEPLGPDVIGVLIYGLPDSPTSLGEIPVLGEIEDIRRVLHERAVDEVVMATHGMSPRQFAAIMAACDELDTPMRQLVLPEFHDGRRLGLERQYGLPFVTLARVERSTEALAVKRAIDVCGSTAALLLLAFPMLLIGLLVLATMGRPVLYSQERIGYRGRRFRMLKFRSMVPDAERHREALSARNEVDGPVFKIADDPRVTPFGRILRKFSLDELPQLFNVLAGSMSLVGPRPLPVAEQQQISGPMRRRLSMRPGITGLWQISGRSNMPFDQWMQKDLEYLDNWSNLLDLKLLALTIPAVFTGRGAK
jgi:exopolysaccharide biosynthesis polyprenyl glycosylphosphotransferase